LSSSLFVWSEEEPEGILNMKSICVLKVTYPVRNFFNLSRSNKC
jgi:hypothetical protein